MSISPFDHQDQIARSIIQQHIVPEKFTTEVEDIRKKNLDVTKEDVINQVVRKVIDEIRESLKKDKKHQKFIKENGFENYFDNTYNILVEDMLTNAFEKLPENVKKNYKNKVYEQPSTLILIAATVMFLVLALIATIKDELASRSENISRIKQKNKKN